MTCRGLLFLLLFALPATARAGEDARDRARALLEAGRFEEAVEAAKEALVAKPGDPLAFTLKGLALSELGDWIGASEAFRSALHRTRPGDEIEQEAVPGMVRALVALARELVDSGEPLAAIEKVTEALVWDPQNLDAILAKAWIHEVLGRREEALEELETALEKHPDHPEALAAMARYRLESGENEEALPLLERLLAEGRPEPTSERRLWAHRAAAWILADRGERGRALVHLAEALALDPTDAETRERHAGLEAFADQARRVRRAERWLLAASAAVLLLWVGGGYAGWRFLKKKGWV